MAIGASVVTNLPTAGTTVHTLAKAKDGVYLVDVTDGSNVAPIILNLRESPRLVPSVPYLERIGTTQG